MMKNFRVKNHPVLEEKDEREKITFFFDNKKMEALKGEVLSSALFANGIRVFGHHHKDGSPQGIFCANGQCAQCNVIVDNFPVKACMTAAEEGMHVFSCDRLPNPDSENGSPEIQGAFAPIPLETCQVFIIGGGPSGISAAIELGKLGIDTILTDDKHEPGGKLLLQSHQFFGSQADCFAGTRGIEIAKIMNKELLRYGCVKVWKNAPVVAVFEDRTFGVATKEGYRLVKPQKTIIAAGAREKSVVFPGWDMPGVYGAGAFQTLLNRDLIKPSERLFIAGGGNVGLITAYHAMQAGITVCGLTEIMDKTGGYLVHSLKIKRLGVPIYLNHTIVRCDGDEKGVQSVTIAKVDGKGNPLQDTQKRIAADTVLLAVGLSPVEELMVQAKHMGMDIDACGDAQEIAEASAAIFSGKITGLKTAKKLGFQAEIPGEFTEKCSILKSRPGKVHPVSYPDSSSKIHPVIHCFEEIPCNPCSTVCPHKSIRLEKEHTIMSVPGFSGKCSGCGQCVLICPGLAITLVEYGDEGEEAKVTVPYELQDEFIYEGKILELTDVEGNVIGNGKIEKIKRHKSFDKRTLVTIAADGKIAQRAAGFTVKELTGGTLTEAEACGDSAADSEIICKCERVTAGEIKEAIRKGAESLSEIKTVLRCTMGACAGKTCSLQISRILKKEGFEPEQISLRPLEMETALSLLAGRTL